MHETLYFHVKKNEEKQNILTVLYVAKIFAPILIL